MIPDDSFVKESYEALLAKAKANGLTYEGNYYMELVSLLKKNGIISEKDFTGHLFFLMDKTMDLPNRDDYWEFI